MKGFLIAAVLALVSAAPAVAAERHHVSPATMNANTRAMFRGLMDTDDKLWDENAKMLRASATAPGKPVAGKYLEDWHYWSKCCLSVRGTGDYALALLVRDLPGDRARAAEALNAVLKVQYLTPGVRWYGTFKRTPQELDPQANPVMWRDYDPNWREFIGTTLEMILIEYPERVPAELRERMYKAIDRAIEGEKAEGRLVPDYTNPSLMYGSLWDFAAAHDKRADWQKESSDWIEGMYALYAKHHAFSEFNSPTYDAVDTYGLALWRDYGTTERIRTLGAQMEAELWNGIADVYQPDLRNMCGPFDRSYGMDMESYVSGVGPLMATVMEMKDAPLPPPGKSGKGTSFGMSPEMMILGTRVPADAMAKLKVFEGAHAMRKQITDDRVATAWVGAHAMWGAESTNKTRDVKAASGSGLNYVQPSQFHPVTVQWRTPSGEIGWMRVVESPMIDAVADEHGVTISTVKGMLRLRVRAKGMSPEEISAAKWDLPGMQVAVTSDGQSEISVAKTDPANVDPVQNGELDGYDVIYRGVTRMRLEMIKAGNQGPRDQGN